MILSAPFFIISRLSSIFHDQRAELLETHYLSNLVRGISVDELDANPRAESSLTVVVG